MTDEQIVKALECCVSSAGGDACRGCPYEEEGICVTDGLALQRDSLALIKRQQAEIEDLKADKEALINGQLTLQKMYLESRAEAVREFAERLIELGVQEGAYEYVSVYDIECLVKEMTEKEGQTNEN